MNVDHEGGHGFGHALHGSNASVDRVEQTQSSLFRWSEASDLRHEHQQRYLAVKMFYESKTV